LTSRLGAAMGEGGKPRRTAAVTDRAGQRPRVVRPSVRPAPKLEEHSSCLARGGGRGRGVVDPARPQTGEAPPRGKLISLQENRGGSRSARETSWTKLRTELRGDPRRDGVSWRNNTAPGRSATAMAGRRRRGPTPAGERSLSSTEQSAAGALRPCEFSTRLGSSSAAIEELCDAWMAGGTGYAAARSDAVDPVEAVRQRDRHIAIYPRRFRRR